MLVNNYNIMNTIAVTKSAFIRVRIEPDLKREAEELLASLGLTPSEAITLFYKQIILHDGLPFSINIPTKPKNNES